MELWDGHWERCKISGRGCKESSEFEATGAESQEFKHLQGSSRKILAPGQKQRAPGFSPGAY